MKKYLIFKKEENSYGPKIGSYQSEFKDDSSANRSYLHAEPMASHFELGEGQDEDVVVPVWVEEEVIPAQGLPEEEGYVPEQVIAAHWALQDDPSLVDAKAAQVKAALITEKYNAMNVDVYSQMAAVFGTTNTDSASAHEKTWALMQSNPSAFANKGLKNHNGDVMITEQDVLDYANIKVQSVIDYGVWRLQRIQQFNDAKALLLGGN